jgi:hypothetical protein
MQKTDRKKVSEEWNKILRNHPTFARAFLAQQAILMEASEHGYSFIDRYMCILVKKGMPVLFEDYWVSRCPERISGEVIASELINCLSQTNRDPADCFGSDDPEGWFDDPLADGQTLPPKPPIPPLK